MHIKKSSDEHFNGYRQYADTKDAAQEIDVTVHHAKKKRGPDDIRTIVQQIYQKHGSQKGTMHIDLAKEEYTYSVGNKTFHGKTAELSQSLSGVGVYNIVLEQKEEPSSKVSIGDSLRSVLQKIDAKIERIAAVFHIPTRKSKLQKYYATNFELLKSVVKAFPSDGTITLSDAIEYHLQVLGESDPCSKKLKECLELSRQLEKIPQDDSKKSQEKEAKFQERVMQKVEQLALNEECIIPAFVKSKDQKVQDALITIKKTGNDEYTMTLVFVEIGDDVEKKVDTQYSYSGKSNDIKQQIINPNVTSFARMESIDKKHTKHPVRNRDPARVLGAYLRVHESYDDIKKKKLKNDVDYIDKVCTTRDDTWLHSPEYRRIVEGSIRKILYAIEKPTNQYEDAFKQSITTKLLPLLEKIESYIAKEALEELKSEQLSAHFNVQMTLPEVKGKQIHLKKGADVVSSYDFEITNKCSHTLNGNAACITQWSEGLQELRKRNEWDRLEATILEIGCRLDVEKIGKLSKEEKALLRPLLVTMAQYLSQAWVKKRTTQRKGECDTQAPLYDHILLVTKLLICCNEISDTKIAVPIPVDINNASSACLLSCNQFLELQGLLKKAKEQNQGAPQINCSMIQQPSFQLRCYLDLMLTNECAPQSSGDEVAANITNHLEKFGNAKTIAFTSGNECVHFGGIQLNMSDMESLSCGVAERRQSDLGEYRLKVGWTDIPTHPQLQEIICVEQGRVEDRFIGNEMGIRGFKALDAQKICISFTKNEDLRDLALTQIDGDRTCETVAAFLKDPPRFEIIEHQQFFMQNFFQINPQTGEMYLKELPAENRKVVIQRLLQVYTSATGAAPQIQRLFLGKVFFLLRMYKVPDCDSLPDPEIKNIFNSFKDSFSVLNDGVITKSLLARDMLFCYFQYVQDGNTLDLDACTTILQMHFYLTQHPIQEAAYQSRIQDDARMRLIEKLIPVMKEFNDQDKKSILRAVLPAITDGEYDYTKFPICTVNKRTIDLIAGRVLGDGVTLVPLPLTVRNDPQYKALFGEIPCWCRAYAFDEADGEKRIVYDLDEPSGVHIQCTGGNIVSISKTIDKETYEYISSQSVNLEGFEQLDGLMQQSTVWKNIGKESVLLESKNESYIATQERGGISVCRRSDGAQLLNPDSLPQEVRMQLQMLGQPLYLWGKRGKLEQVEYWGTNGKSFLYTIRENRQKKVELVTKDGNWALQPPGTKVPKEMYTAMEGVLDSHFFMHCHVLKNASNQYKVLIPARQFEYEAVKFRRWLMPEQFGTAYDKEKGELFYECQFVDGKLVSKNIEANLALALYLLSSNKYSQALEILQKNCRTSFKYGEREKKILQAILEFPETHPNGTAVKMRALLLLKTGNQKIEKKYQEGIKQIHISLQLTAAEKLLYKQLFGSDLSGTEVATQQTQITAAEAYLIEHPVLVEEKTVEKNERISTAVLLDFNLSKIGRVEKADTEGLLNACTTLFATKEDDSAAVKATFGRYEQATKEFIQKTPRYTYSVTSEGLGAIIQDLQTKKIAADKAVADLRNNILCIVNGVQQEGIVHRVSPQPQYTFEQILGFYVQESLGEMSLQTILDETITKLDEIITKYLIAATCAQQIDAALNQARSIVQPTGEEVEALYELLAQQRAYNPQKDLRHRQFLLIEYVNKFILRENNISAVEDIIQNPSAVRQLEPGAGKTTNIEPLVMKFRADGKVLPVLILPEAGYENTLKELDKTSQSFFQQNVYRLQLDRMRLNEMHTDDFEKIYLDLVHTIENRGFVATTRTAMMSLHHGFIERLDTCLKNQDSDQKNQDPNIFKEVKAFAKIIKLLKDRGVGLCDEIHEVLRIDKEINYSLDSESDEQPKLNPIKVDIGATIFQRLLQKDTTPEIRVIAEAIQNKTQANLTSQKMQEGLCAIACTFFQDYRAHLLPKDIDEKTFVQYVTTGSLDAKFVKEGMPIFMSTLYEKEETERVYQEIAALKSFLSFGFAAACRKSNSVGYGRSENGNDVVPFAAANLSQEESQFDNEAHRITTCLINYFQDGLNTEQVERLVRAYKSQAYRECQQMNVSWSNTPAAKEFQRLFKMSLSTVTPKDIESIQRTVNQNNEKKCEYCRSYVLSAATKSMQQIRGNAQDLPEMLRTMGGLSGTTSNYRTYNNKIDCKNAEEMAVYGKMITTLLAKQPKVHVINHEENMIGALLSPSDTPRPLVIVDGGCFAKGKSNAEQAALMADAIFKEQGSKTEPLKAIVFVNEENKTVARLIGTGETIPFDELTFRGIESHERITFYDDAHKQGTDIRQASNAAGVITYGEKMSFEILVQAIRRLRKVDKGQTFDYAIDDSNKKLISDKEEEITQNDLLRFALRLQVERTVDETYQSTCDKIRCVLPNCVFEELVNGAAADEVEQESVMKLFIESRALLIPTRTEEEDWRADAMVTTQREDVDGVLEEIKTAEQKKVEKFGENIAHTGMTKLEQIVIPPKEELPQSVRAALPGQEIVEGQRDTMSTNQVATKKEIESQKEELQEQVAETVTEKGEIKRKRLETEPILARYMGVPSVPLAVDSLTDFFSPRWQKETEEGEVNETCVEDRTADLTRDDRAKLFIAIPRGYGAQEVRITNGNDIIVSANWHHQNKPICSMNTRAHKPVTHVALLTDQFGNKKAVLMDSFDFHTTMKPLCETEKAKAEQTIQCDIFDFRPQGEPLWIGGTGNGPTNDVLATFAEQIVEIKLIAGKFSFNNKEFEVLQDKLRELGASELFLKKSDQTEFARKLLSLPQEQRRKEMMIRLLGEKLRAQTEQNEKWWWGKERLDTERPYEELKSTLIELNKTNPQAVRHSAWVLEIFLLVEQYITTLGGIPEYRNGTEPPSEQEKRFYESQGILDYSGKIVHSDQYSWNIDQLCELRFIKWCYDRKDHMFLEVGYERLYAYIKNTLSERLFAEELTQLQIEYEQLYTRLKSSLDHLDNLERVYGECLHRE